MNYKLLDSFAISISAAESTHPNEMKFKGVLVRVDEPSTKAPNGSRGHRILIPSTLAAKQLHTLVGMGVNYSSDMKSHAPTKKVGVIQKAWLKGKDLWVEGIIWKKDFPDAVKDLSKANLGMSFEASEISVEDEDADIWVLNSLCFTGATILYKTSAAYYKTSADAMAASAEVVTPARLIKINSGRKFMPVTLKNKKNRPGKSNVTAGADNSNDALVQAFTTALAPVLTELKAQGKRLETMQASVESLESSSNEEEEVEVEENDANIEAGSDEDESMESSKKKNEDDDMDDEDDEDDEDDIDSGADDEGKLADLGDGDEGEKDGQLNKENGRVNKGRSVAQKKAGKPMSSAADKQTIAELRASNEEQAQKIAELQRVVRRNQKQLQAAGERTDRKSVALSTILSQTLAKGGVDIQAMSDAGEKMTISEIDTIFASHRIDSITAMGMKNDMVRAGLLESGEIKAAGR